MASIARCLSPVSSKILFNSIQPSFQRQLGLKAASFQSGRSVGIRKFSALGPLQVKKYTKDHEWIELSEDGSTGTRIGIDTRKHSKLPKLGLSLTRFYYSGTIGVSEYAAKSLGDVVFVELPTLDLEVNAGDTIGAVESVKSASDIMTPVSGKIVGANDVLEAEPSTINKGPEGDGWIAKISMKDKKELEQLMDAEEYKAFTEE
ncbi:MAG: hypothetical protein M1836_007705 [Candelina mexicana]|nr:MAG: hypothetical protein M1836_007705 [Candelina mexicana]